MALVQTVRGPVAADRLGRTLAHEHVVMVTDWIARDYPHLSLGSDRSAVAARVADRLNRIKAAGIDTIIDCTAMGHSRDVPLLVEVNRLTNINIVTSTGVYTFDALPLFFKFRPPPEAGAKAHDILTEMFLHDINVGVQGTGVRAAIIKCATDAPGMTPNIVRILTACAHAHRETGAPIVTHTLAASRCGLDQQALFKAKGVDLRRVVIGHSGDSDDFDYLQQLLDAGSFIGADRFGLEMNALPNVAQRCAIVARLVALGYEDQILLSHDSSVATDWWPEHYGQDQPWRQTWNLELIPRTVLPMLLELGVSGRAIDKMLIDNPRRWLGGNEPY
jgi:phosphotriesterase-related protein